MPKLATLVCDAAVDVSLVNKAWSTMGQIFRFCEEHDNKRKPECQLNGDYVTLSVTIKVRISDWMGGTHSVFCSEGAGSTSFST